MTNEHALTDDRIATTAACTVIGVPQKKRQREDVLTTTEWNQLARWLVSTESRPADLLFGALRGELEHADLTSHVKQVAIAIEDRASATLAAMETLQEAGIWIRCRADADYPAKWKARLRAMAPPVVFGVGSIASLDEPAIAIVGSREVTNVLADIAGKVGASVVNAGMVVISGAARGTDRFGMLGALDASGRSVGVLPGSLRKVAQERELQDRIAENRLTFVSHVSPAAGFSVGNAMARNRLIYALSDMTIVISTTEGAGGTWAGAMENFQRRWAPVVAWSGVGAPEANTRLIEFGAFPLAEIPATPDEVHRLVHMGASQFQASNPGTEQAPRLIQETPPIY